MIAAYNRDSLVEPRLGAQKEKIQDWLKTEKIDADAVSWYIDRLEKGRPTKSGIEDLTKAVHANKVSKVVVWKLDRLGQTTGQVVSLLNDWLDRGVTTVSVKEKIHIQGRDTSLEQLLSALKNIEEVARKERQAKASIHAQKKAAARKRHIEQARKLKQDVWDLYHAGLSVQEIAKKLGISVDKVENCLIII